MVTPVLFRAERSGKFKGDITAVFPTLPGSPGCMTCYAHVGQHSSCTIEWYYTTRPARIGACADLIAELQSIGYDDLIIYSRITSAVRAERNRAERE